MLRKQILGNSPATPVWASEAKDIPALATVLVSSETADHPIDFVFDGQCGPGGSHWIASESGVQTLILAFDTPQTIRALVVEIEEQQVSRTQELHLSISDDSGQSYRDVLRQEYNFSPPGTTFEREEWSVPTEGITHLRLMITPDKGGKPCRATLTSVALH
jgi:hypothetical protein